MIMIISIILKSIVVIPNDRSVHQSFAEFGSKCKQLRSAGPNFRTPARPEHGCSRPWETVEFKTGVRAFNWSLSSKPFSRKRVLTSFNAACKEPTIEYIYH